MTFHYLGSEDGSFTGLTIIRAAIEVAADGQSLTATYTLELVSVDNTNTDQYGLGGVNGMKTAVEAMGTPKGSIEDLFAQFEEGTPDAATPAP
jgi:hypothetical protein